MAHIGKESRLQSISLQSFVTGCYQLFFGSLITLDTLTNTQYHIRCLGIQTIVRSTTEFPPFIFTFSATHTETHPGIHFLAFKNSCEMSTSLFQIIRMNKKLQFFPQDGLLAGKPEVIEQCT